MRRVHIYIVKQNDTTRSSSCRAHVNELTRVNVSRHNNSFWKLSAPKLVGGWATPLENMKASWDDYSQYMDKWKMFQTTNQKQFIGIGVLKS